jgi:threonine dehydratase
MAVTARDVEAAAAAIAGQVVRTPLVPSPRFAEQFACELYLKLENLQATGSFKDRGAGNKLHRMLADAPRPAGVIAASAGNHAQGVALHARRLGIPATIVMPAWTPFSKVERTEGLGAAVVQHGESLAEAQEHALELGRDRGLTFVHPYDDEAIIAGQGTVALEMLQDRPDLDVLVVPVGGGGLIAGIACWTKERHPRVNVIGVQTALCPAMHAAVRGLPPPPLRTDTLADGIAVKRPGKLTTALIAAAVDDIVLVDEAALEHGVHALAAQQRIVAEGAGAAAFAAVLADPRPFAGRRVGIVVSGGNIDRRKL